MVMVMYLLSYVSGSREDFGTSQAKLLDTWSASKIEPEDWRSIIQKDPMENTSTTNYISQDQYSFQVQGVVDYTWKKTLLSVTFRTDALAKKPRPLSWRNAGVLGHVARM